VFDRLKAAGDDKLRRMIIALQHNHQRAKTTALWLWKLGKTPEMTQEPQERLDRAARIIAIICPKSSKQALRLWSVFVREEKRREEQAKNGAMKLLRTLAPLKQDLYFRLWAQLANKTRKREDKLRLGVAVLGRKQTDIVAPWLRWGFDRLARPDKRLHDAVKKLMLINRVDLQRFFSLWARNPHDPNDRLKAARRLAFFLAKPVRRILVLWANHGAKKTEAGLNRKVVIQKKRRK
jgi:hypothetical protein